MRNGEVIQELINNPLHDINNQVIYDIKPTKVIKGDALITECKYDTTSRNNFTFVSGG